MAQPVWVLSVDLQAKTATFQSGMADAAKSARGAFKDIQGGSSAMNREVGVNMFEARHGVMLLAQEFGVHLPRALTSFVADIGPVGAALEAAFPFLAIAVGATLLLEHLAKLKEEGEKLTEDQIKLATVAQNAFNTLDEKLLSAGIKADELRQDHLAALKKQLELIDRQSMAELVHEFDIVAKAADVVFKDLESHWYTFGIGSSGAQHALTSFKTEYESLLAQGKDKEAADLLRGTRESAERILAAQKEINGSRTAVGGIGENTKSAAYKKLLQDGNLLKEAGVGLTEKEVQAQDALVAALRAQAEVQDKVSALKKAEGGNAKASTGKTMQDEAKKDSDAILERRKEAAEETRKLEDAAKKELIQELQDSEKQKIAATEEGSKERLAAISKAIHEEERQNLESTQFYRELLLARVAVDRQVTDEANRQTAEAGREAAENSTRMAELTLAAALEQQSLTDSARRMTIQRRITEEIAAANQEYSIKMTGFSREIASLNKHDKDYENKLKAINDKQKQLAQQHENDITRIKDQAQMQRNAHILAAENQAQDMIARGLTIAILRQQSFGAMMGSIGGEIAAGMLQNAIKSMLTLDMTKEKEADAAARKGYLAGMSFPFPVNVVMGPVLGAAAFAAVMAFETGGIVPGVGRGDVVPAMLTPGEAVLPKSLMDRINGGEGSSKHFHVHVRPTYHVNTIDGDGMKTALAKHTDVLQRHVEKTLRKMNR